MHTDPRVAYLAGIVDGEGCFVFDDSQYIRPQLKVAMCDERTIRWIHQQFGGAVSKRLADSALNREEQFVWGIYRREDMLRLLPELMNWLICKKLHCELVLEFCHRFPFGNGAPAEKEEMLRYVEFMHRINSRGTGSSELKQRMHKAVGRDFPSFNVFPYPGPFKHPPYRKLRP